MTVERTIVPARALGLRGGFYLRRAGVVMLVLAMATGLGAGTAWAVSGAWSIRRDQRVWDNGTPAAAGMLVGEVRSHGLGWFMAWYDLEVTYSDAEGAQYRGPVEMVTMLGKADTDADPVVRYDRAHHDRFALSWAVEASGARWRWVVIGGGLFAVLTVLMLWLTLVLLKEVAAVRRCARAGREVVVKVADERFVDDSKGRRTSKCRYTFVVPADGGGADRWVEEVDLAKRQPLFVDAARTSAYALVGPAAKVRILVLEDLYPLAVTAAERAAARDRVTRS